MQTDIRDPSAFSVTRPKSTVVNFVLERIKQAIVSGELKPGDLMPSEAELTASLGVGKTSIREAVKMLQAVGAVDIRQGHGTVIRREPGPDMLSPLVFQLLLKDGTSADLLEFRQQFEPGWSLLAMQKATEEDIKRIEGTIDLMEKNIQMGVQTADDDLAFHRAILETTHNPYMITIGGTILELFRASIQRSMNEIPSVAARDHRAIFDAFKSKDAGKLLKAIEASYEGWAHSLAAQPEHA